MQAITNRKLSSKHTDFQKIPIIDIAPLLDGSNPQAVAKKIGEVCENIGFLYIRNHGISDELISDAYTLAQQFFDQPLEQKNQFNIVNSGPTLRGYIPLYGENVDPVYTKDFKECFDLGAHSEDVSPFFGPNLMPKQPERFQAVFEEYHSAMLSLSRQLIQAIAISLDLPADYFEKLQQQPITIQRLLHYPPQQGEIKLEELGIGAHTDYGFLTILAQDENGGLQVQNRAGEWIDAPPVPGTFVVNIGDLVQTFTNDRYLSTLHRVINTSGRERYSLPFFIDMDSNAEVKPVATCVSPENPARYSTYTCGEHKFKRFKDSYSHLQEDNVA